MGTVVDVTSTTAVEVVAGALSRAFASVKVEGPRWVQEIITPAFLVQIGRDLISSGDSMHGIRMNDGMV